jgi:hypothetical protein
MIFVRIYTIVVVFSVLSYTISWVESYGMGFPICLLFGYRGITHRIYMFVCLSTAAQLVTHCYYLTVDAAARGRAMSD